MTQYDEASLKDSLPPETATCISKFQDECLISMSDDLHTSVALAAITEPLKTINDLLHTRKVLWLQVKESIQLCCSSTDLHSTFHLYLLT